MKRMGVGALGYQTSGRGCCSGPGHQVWVKFQDPPGLALPGKRNQGVGQA